MKTVLLTGATGFLGSRLARRLLEEDGVEIIALVRAKGAEAARRRLLRAWGDRPELAAAVGSRVSVLAGDVTMPALALTAPEREALVEKITHVIHAAAQVRMDRPIEELRKTNVLGTANVIELARAAHERHSIERFSHVSTAYVAGGKQGEVAEDSLTDEFGFSSAYELSKYECELLVKEAGGALPVCILRPGIIVGDSRTGEIDTFNTVYLPLRFYLTGKLRILPASGSLRVSFTPVDYVADAAVRLTFDRRAEGLTFHLTAGPGALPTVKELMDFAREWAAEHLGVRLPRALFLPAARRSGRGASRDRRTIEGERPANAGVLELLAPYFRENRVFRRENTDRLLGPYAIEWRALFPTLLEYAVARGFMHSSGRTVHEQILHRLESRSRPVAHYDIVDGRAIKRDSGELRREMLTAARALGTLGIRPGDRVAIVGSNGTRYLALDVAIGVAGAVSVPLYYTSPPCEIDGILQASGARILFVGAPQVLERIDEIETNVKVVSFCRRPTPPGISREVVGWHDFLASAGGNEAPAEAPVLFDDLATLRYTSGTTGRPKGVMFSHGGLRFMAESTLSLMPWKARTSPIRYLSFLPLNHVVEGILSTYSAYYAPAPVSVYYLHDFKGLAEALPLVRPTVFFSVPRVYEKIWGGLLSSSIGRWYARSRPGPAKRLFGLFLRRALLRRSGLDRCRNLIVGSAPMAEKLLDSFRELGIEIHNAYGLTEAPLVTLNRWGSNRIGTVGEPLPRTEVAIAEDGEILVRGPQVTTGYFEKGAESPFRDGWLRTGDVGRVENGYLVIEGRRKEMIATSYGKKIHPCAVETMLKDIAGVSEAMLVGESRPYCVALLWVTGGWSRERADRIDRAVETVNSRLSRAERLRRWAVLAHDLSPDGGELTANYKLKRAEVGVRRRALIRSLYDECGVPEPVLHVGRTAQWD